MFKPNIGTLNALIRITGGLILLSWGTAQLVKRPYRNFPLISVMAGAMKVAEGITRFCPVVFLYEERVQEHEEDDYSNINPS
ncbi:DUF2892 domain-containing protein [Salipaludibacillus sp. CUR1]|uniref:YgaP family membrane protein n=1 Tax=Salipaludibacillus sp. CUR1 TaxID=2820003 RepID=UPI001E37B06C|nr:DUF2892 domain-containing protein [Salipaludibacillus sp. CUR1]MCE7792560.1 DUF2892 domain-containing protein [Salipaludibacillus sp. CUR1]